MFPRLSFSQQRGPVFSFTGGPVFNFSGGSQIQLYNVQGVPFSIAQGGFPNLITGGLKLVARIQLQRVSQISCTGVPKSVEQGFRIQLIGGTLIQF